MKSLYKLTKGDREIFELTKQTNDPDILLNYYLRSDTSGTWWLPGAKSEHWKRGYEKLLAAWESSNRPPEYLEYSGNLYKVHAVHEKSRLHPDLPAFFHNHGKLMLPWAKELYGDRTPFVAVVGGFGSGKTLNEVFAMLVEASTMPGYRAFALAPMSIQANEFHKLILDNIAGTLFEERFLIAAPKKPFPHIVIGNSDVGINTIECYPILGSVEKLRTLTGDRAVVDQAEKLDNGQITEVINSVGSRFRGRVARNGRERIGTLHFIANTGDNQELWDLYDKAQDDPKNYKSLSPSSYDNIYLTDADIERFELMFPDEQSRRMYMFGDRPLGNGEHFSQQTLGLMQDENLDRVMEQGLSMNLPGYIKLEAKGVGVYEWLLPPVEGRQYLVISDPGTKNPPHRDSPPILVWDITGFPGTGSDPVPVKLVGFVWVFGNGDIQNWADRYAALVRAYKAQLSNGFDATGFQAGYDQWMAILTELYPEKINLAGNGKLLCLNSAKILTTAGMVRLPKGIPHLYSQLSRYKYDEDTRANKMRQDIVMAFIMSCWWLQRLYFTTVGTEMQEVSHDTTNRYARQLGGRHRAHAR
jgi:hypothetical protein